MSREQRKLAVIGVGQKTFIARRAAVPAPPFAAVTHAILKLSFGVTLHHRPENPLGLGAASQLIKRLDVEIGVARRPQTEARVLTRRAFRLKLTCHCHKNQAVFVTVKDEKSSATN